MKRDICLKAKKSAPLSVVTAFNSHAVMDAMFCLCWMQYVMM